MFDEELLQKSIENYLKFIEDKNWPDLTKEQIELIKDDSKRKEYLKKYKECVRKVIMPLIWHIDNKSHFKFTNPDNLLTCNNMMKDIYSYYQKKGYDKKDLCTIASDKDVGKRY